MSWRYAWFGATVLIDIDFYLETFLIVPAFLVVINISVTEKQTKQSVDDKGSNQSDTAIAREISFKVFKNSSVRWIYCNEAFYSRVLLNIHENRRTVRGAKTLALSKRSKGVQIFRLKYPLQTCTHLDLQAIDRTSIFLRPYVDVT